MTFPSLSAKVRPSDVLVFFDFEGTQFTHKAIALGLLLVPKKEGELFSTTKPLSYSCYLKTKDRIGPLVQKMTGITPDLLKEKGIPFSDMLTQVRALLTPYQHPLFLSYGKNDTEMVSRSINYQHPEEVQERAYLLRHYFDVENYLARYIVGKDGMPLSVGRLLEFFQIPAEGKLHDPLADSKALLSIYRAFVSDEAKTIDRVLSCYPDNRTLLKPAKELANLLLSQGSVSVDDLRKEIGKAL